MRQLETSSLSNQNISAALLCHTYTADADRAIFFRLFADQVVGNGDYVAYLTIQRLGAGSFYRAIPITTANAASGVTSIMLVTITIPIKNTDVVKVYLTGLAGDTVTPDIVTEVWEMSYLRPTVAGRTLDVDASGGTEVGSFQAGAIGAAAFAAGAIDAAAIATGAVDADALAADAVGEIADGVWDEATAGHVGAGTTGKALTDANNGTPPTANAIADQVWDEQTAGHVAAGSTGKALTDLTPGAAIVLNADITEIHT